MTRTPVHERMNLAAICAAQFLTLAGMTAVLPLLPLYLQQIGITDRDALRYWTGILGSAPFAVAVFSTPFWGALADRVGHKPMVVRSVLGIAVTVFGMGVAGSPFALLGWRAVQGAVSGVFPAAVALVSSLTPAERVGQALAILQSARAAGGLSGPLIGGFLADRVGIRGLFFGVGAIGHTFAEASPRLGELIGAAGVVAYQPTEGSGVPDYLIGTSEQPATTVVASGLLCRGAFETLSRFTKRPGGQPVPLSELARVCLDHSSSASVGVVMLVEVAGLVGARLRRSPGDPARPVRFAMPEVRDAFSITPERVHEGTVAVVTGVVSRNPDARLTPLLRPIGMSSDLLGHFHAAVFEFRPVPLRTVALRPLMTKYFSQQPLRSVMHLLHDDRGAAGAGESAVLRGICWVSPITAIEGGA